jgi:ABC-2 type transport system permease protein
MSLAVRQHLEYRFNFFIDVVAQPCIAASIEMAIWFSLSQAMTREALGGFTTNDYLIYSLWGSFFARQMGSWSNDFSMANDIQHGTLNTTLTRPLSFFEYHFFQFFGHRMLGLLVSLSIPAIASLWLRPDLDYSRLPVALCLGLGFLVFGFSLSFLIITMGFHLTRVHSLIFAKNISLWMLTGEIFPLDLLPEHLARIAKVLPFASGVFLPVGYLTGRIGIGEVHNGMLGLAAGLCIIGILCWRSWTIGIKRYSGVGA